MNLAVKKKLKGLSPSPLLLSGSQGYIAYLLFDEAQPVRNRSHWTFVSYPATLNFRQLPPPPESTSGHLHEYTLVGIASYLRTHFTRTRGVIKVESVSSRAITPMVSDLIDANLFTIIQTFSTLINVCKNAHNYDVTIQSLLQHNMHVSSQYLTSWRSG